MRSTRSAPYGVDPHNSRSQSTIGPRVNAERGVVLDLGLGWGGGRGGGGGGQT
jgi:hypothetical protein